jgi:hypothetical protein
MVAVIAYGIYQFRSTAGKGLARVRTWASQNRWSLPTIVGIAMILTAIPCRIGVGGDSNDQSPPVYFLAAAAALGLAQCITQTASPRTRKAHWIAKPLLLILLVTSSYIGLTPPEALSQLFRALPYSPAQRTYDLAKKNPAMIYFPGNPLTSLLADGKLTHFLMGLHERAMDGYPPSREYFWEYMPTNMQLIVLPDPAWMKDYVEEFRPYLQQFSPAMRDPSGWFVYRRLR